MVRFNYELTIGKIERFRKEGRGEGELENYKPWITVRDLSSEGRSSREFGVKATREYHLLSDLERYFFYITEWDDNVIDIREQYPIKDRTKTMEVAEILGYDHPRDRKTKVNAVMTVDFLITYKGSNGEITTIARSIKPFSKLQNKRNLEKLLIEKYYFESIGIDWGVVTDREINRNFALNLQELRDYQLHHYEIDKGILTLLTKKIKSFTSTTSVIDSIRELSKQIGVDEATLLNGIKILIITKKLQVDLTKRLNFNMPWKKFLGGNI